MFRLMNPGIEYSESVNQFGLYLYFSTDVIKFYISSIFPEIIF